MTKINKKEFEYLKNVHHLMYSPFALVTTSVTILDYATRFILDTLILNLLFPTTHVFTNESHICTLCTMQDNLFLFCRALT
jgi:hypothetical protein